MNRTVEINVDLDRVKHENNQQLQQAIGRLSLWGPTLQTVRIFNDGDNDLIAVYLDNDVRRYVIGAVWRPESNEYTFHS